MLRYLESKGIITRKGDGAMKKDEKTQKYLLPLPREVFFNLKKIFKTDGKFDIYTGYEGNIINDDTGEKQHYLFVGSELNTLFKIYEETEKEYYDKIKSDKFIEQIFYNDIMPLKERDDDKKFISLRNDMMHELFDNIPEMTGEFSVVIHKNEAPDKILGMINDLKNSILCKFACKILDIDMNDKNELNKHDIYIKKIMNGKIFREFREYDGTQNVEYKRCLKICEDLRNNVKTVFKMPNAKHTITII